MAVLAKDLEISSSIRPAKMFQAFVLEAEELLPKILPQAFKSLQLLEGDGGPGSIKKITFGEGSIFWPDSWIEGDVLMNVFEKISYEVEFKEGHPGGLVCKVTTKFHVANNIQLDEGQLEAGKEKITGLIKAVEGYVLANP